MLSLLKIELNEKRIWFSHMRQNKRANTKTISVSPIQGEMPALSANKKSPIRREIFVINSPYAVYAPAGLALSCVEGCDPAA